MTSWKTRRRKMRNTVYLNSSGRKLGVPSVKPHPAPREEEVKCNRAGRNVPGRAE